jgi:hypothetical protein
MIMRTSKSVNTSKLQFRERSSNVHLGIPFYLLLQTPQAPQVDQYFQVFPPQPKTILAQFKFWLESQGALPPLQEAQFMVLT